MRLIDEALSPHLWIYSDNDLTEQQRRDHLVLEALLHLGATVAVSERGLNRDDAGEFGVPELLDEWHKLMTGLSRLLDAAGINGSRVLPPASAKQSATPTPGFHAPR